MLSRDSADSLVVVDRRLSYWKMNSILLTWDIEEYDVSADFGGALLPDEGIERGTEIWQ